MRMRFKNEKKYLHIILIKIMNYTTNPIHENTKENDDNINPLHNSYNLRQAMKQQDDNIDLLKQGIDRLSHISKIINDESKLQFIMCDDLEKDVDKNNLKISFVNNNLQKFIKDVVNLSFCNNYLIIILLIIILIILLFCVLYY